MNAVNELEEEKKTHFKEQKHLFNTNNNLGIILSNIRPKEKDNEVKDFKIILKQK